jgi:glycosyltransferase involved in cell wall biosynthesis
MKVALVYDRVNKWGGAERVLLVLHELFPNAPLYTSVYSPKNARWAKVFPKVIPSFIQKFPLAKDRHEHFPYLMPIAFETFDFCKFDLVISVTSEAVKGIITVPPTKHICYCLTPTRYLWSGYKDYFKYPPIKYLSQPFIKYLRFWDKIAAQRPDVMIAISTEVQKRIKKYYGRDSTTIFPPVEIEQFSIRNSQLRKKKTSDQLLSTNYYLVVSRLVPYKKVDLVIEAFNELGYPLVVVGTGWEEKKLKGKANNNVIFTGYLTDKELAGYYQKARALIFPQEEDFGLVAVEAQAAGVPVIAYKKGGSIDTIIDGKTGIFFENQTVAEIVNAVKRFVQMNFDTIKIRKNAQKFSKEIFIREFFLLIDKFLKDKNI